MWADDDMNTKKLLYYVRLPVASAFALRLHMTSTAGKIDLMCCRFWEDLLRRVGAGGFYAVV